MADKFMLSISHDYPEAYWLKTHILTGEDSGVFKEGVAVDGDIKARFECSGSISEVRFLRYDFLFSDGPNLISPRLHKMMLEEELSGVQFVDAELMVNGVVHEGYKVFNVVERSPVFDLIKSVSEPLISSMPDGPQWYSKIVLDDSFELPCDVVRAQEELATVVVSLRVKSVFEKNNVRGVQFVR
ncbi:imm11 family protein [Pseudomonas sp. PSKL.D1]|uniref:imm11 family protein n=1 Tax=Pseudomonas sp. PSKL.D1 TaxID=3029060 RepID=UPI0023812E2A|nr:hypothetical protein [Pseudomonas sp. PSKL.D1]WDY56479.1 hypothetical protein PVV54_17975 [Pseudomonas sp. PSKL.D1]